jgi:peroxiredoxin
MTRLRVGDAVQDFTLPSSIGQPVTLSEVLKQGPVVLAWYPFDFGRI